MSSARWMHEQSWGRIACVNHSPLEQVGQARAEVKQGRLRCRQVGEERPQHGCLCGAKEWALVVAGIGDGQPNATGNQRQPTPANGNAVVMRTVVLMWVR